MAWICLGNFPGAAWYCWSHITTSVTSHYRRVIMCLIQTGILNLPTAQHFKRFANCAWFPLWYIILKKVQFMFLNYRDRSILLLVMN